MIRLTKFPKAAIGLFNNLCLSQVKDQLFENLLYCNSNPPGFVFEGQLFAFADNCFILSENPVAASGSNLMFAYSDN